MSATLHAFVRRDGAAHFACIGCGTVMAVPCPADARPLCPICRHFGADKGPYIRVFLQRLGRDAEALLRPRDAADAGSTDSVAPRPEAS